jgi:5-methylcytosine-specific restriction endonuclease McrA
MLWNETAQVVEPDEYRTYSWEDRMGPEPPPGVPGIRSARARLRVAEVIGLTRYDRLPWSAVTFSRRDVASRDHHTCLYCGAQPGWESITVDRVVPRSQGGTSTWTNCVAACVECDARMADRTPEQAGMQLRRRPAGPAWKPLYAMRETGIASWSRFLAPCRGTRDRGATGTPSTRTAWSYVTRVTRRPPIAPRWRASRPTTGPR